MTDSFLLQIPPLHTMYIPRSFFKSICCKIVLMFGKAENKAREAADGR